jgi:hypothetical protein
MKNISLLKFASIISFFIKREYHSSVINSKSDNLPIKISPQFTNYLDGIKNILNQNLDEIKTQSLIEKS